MRLSSKGRYGIQAVFHLATRPRGTTAQVREIAEQQQIPARFLEQVFQDLKRAGIVRSKRGPKGGYELAQPPASIRIGDIVRALEGPVALTASDDSESQPENSRERQVVESTLDELAQRIEACLDSLTVDDLCARCARMDSTPSTHRGYVFAI